MSVFICPQAPFLPCSVWEADLGGQPHLSSYALWLLVGYKQWGAMQMWEGIQVARDTGPLRAALSPGLALLGFHFTPLCSWVGVTALFWYQVQGTEVSFFPAHSFANYSFTKLSEISHVNVLSSSR